MMVIGMNSETSLSSRSRGGRTLTTTLKFCELPPSCVVLCKEALSVRSWCELWEESCYF
jgi:hypothetical protein